MELGSCGVFILCLFFILMAGSLGAVRSSAAALALADVSLLSDSADATAISPIADVAGIAFSYISPFSTPGIHLCGLHQSFKVGEFKFGAGTGYLNHEDYTAHNPYLNAAWLKSGFALGASLHLDYDSVGDDGEYRFGGDIAMGYSYKDYRAEARCLDIGGEEAEMGVFLAKEINEAVSLGGGYVHPKAEKGSMRVAMTYKLHENLDIYGSWMHYPASFGGGVRLSHDKLRLIYSMRTHTELRPSHGLSLEYGW